MSRYEIFRQSVAGWSFIVSFIVLALPRIDLSDLSDWKWAVVFAAGLLSSPVFGYIINQVIRAWYVITKSRPNDRHLNIKKLHSRFTEIINPETHGAHLSSLRDLPPKDLHRVIWVTFANNDLRDRSESYWERYYTNLGIVASICVGTISAIVIFLLNQYFWELLNLIKLAIFLLIVIALIIDSRKYLQICTLIENIWNNAFIHRLKEEPEYFKNGLFKV